MYGQVLREIGDPRTLKGLQKIYGIDYMSIAKSETVSAVPGEGDIGPGLVVRNQFLAPGLSTNPQQKGTIPVPLPRYVCPGVWCKFKLPVGEDICDSGGEVKKNCVTKLRVQFSAFAAGDLVCTKINTHWIQPSTIEAVSTIDYQGGTHSVGVAVFAFDPSLIHPCVNVVKLRIGEPNSTVPCVEQLDLLVTYE